MKLTTKVPPPLTWHIYQIVVDCLSLIVIAYVLNQSKENWLLSDALHWWAWNWKKKPKNTSSFQTLMEEDFGVALELICLASNIRKEVCGVLDNLFFFLKRFNERKAHNVLVLMLDPKLKSLRLVFSSIGRDQGVTWQRNF